MVRALEAMETPRDDAIARWEQCLGRFTALRQANPGRPLVECVDTIDVCGAPGGGENCCPADCIEQFKRLCAALGAIGPGARDAAPALLALVEKDKPYVSRWAVEALGDIRPDATVVGPALINTLRVPVLRREALGALSKIGCDPGSTVPALIPLLADGEPGVRRAAADLLGKMGPAAKPALPALDQLLRGNDTSLRDSAAQAIRQIDGRR
jgi:HEAT repeat protein